MDSICVGGTFHCSSDNERQSSWYWIHHHNSAFTSIRSPPSLPFFYSLSLYCIQGGSHFFMLPLSGTSPFLINNFRTENSGVFQCSWKALALLLNYSQNQFSASIIKNTSCCYRIDCHSEDRNGSVGEERLCHATTTLVLCVHCCFACAEIDFKKNLMVT